SAAFLQINNQSSTLVHIDSLSLPTGFTYSYPNSGQDILPYHTIYITVNFNPSIAQLYSGTGVVHSNAVNDPVSFQVSGTGVNTSISWIGAYNMPTYNPNINTLSLLTSNYVNSLTVSPIHLCADGSKATIFKYFNGDGTITTSNI